MDDIAAIALELDQEFQRTQEALTKTIEAEYAKKYNALRNEIKALSQPMSETTNDSIETQAPVDEKALISELDKRFNQHKAKAKTHITTLLDERLSTKKGN
jgi:hypothetical protein